MLRGNIPCTWDQNFVEKFHYELQKRKLVIGTTVNTIDLLDPTDLD